MEMTNDHRPLMKSEVDRCKALEQMAKRSLETAADALRLIEELRLHRDPAGPDDFGDFLHGCEYRWGLPEGTLRGIMADTKQTTYDFTELVKTWDELDDDLPW